MENKIAKIYALGLYEVAIEAGSPGSPSLQNKKEEIDESFSIFVSALQSSSELLSVLKSFSISKNEKKEVVKNLFEKELKKEFLHFVYILIEKNRIALIFEIRKEYRDLVFAKEGITYGEIYSAKELEGGQLEKFEKDVSVLLQKNIKLKNEVDTSLIAGVKIFCDGKFIDASLQGALLKMKTDLSGMRA